MANHGLEINQFRPLQNNDDSINNNENNNTIRGPRSIDDYLDSAYQHTCTSRAHNGILFDILQHWRYYIIFLALGIANTGDSAEMGVTNYILSSSKFQHDILNAGEGVEEDGGADFAQRGAAIAGSHFAGMLISGLLSGVLADIWGRRSTLLLGLTCNTAVGVLSALSRNATELCILRFLCGIGLGMVIAGVVTLSAEISPPSKRGRFMTLVASCYTLGFLYTAFTALLIFRTSGSGSWRLFMFMNALPTIVAATLVTLFAPESPRFFLCRGRLKEAVHASNLIASRIGYVEKLLTEEELKQYLFHAKRIGQASFRAKETIQLNEVENDVDKKKEPGLAREVWTSLMSIKQVFVRGYWRTTVPLQLTYFCLTLVTGVATWWTKIFQLLELQTDAYALSFYQTLSQVPGMILASGLIDYVGRRRFIMVGFGGGAASLILLSVISNTIQHSSVHSSGGWAVLLLTCAYTICLCVGWLSLDCLSAESFPTKIRSTGCGVCKATGRLAGFCVQFLYGPLVDENRVSHMMIIAAMFAIGGVVMSYQTTDTTKVDLQDHWDYSSTESVSSDTENGSQHIQAKRISFAETKHSKYFSIGKNEP